METLETLTKHRSINQNSFKLGQPVSFDSFQSRVFDAKSSKHGRREAFVRAKKIYGFKSKVASRYRVGTIGISE